MEVLLIGWGEAGSRRNCPSCGRAEFAGPEGGSRAAPARMQSPGAGYPTVPDGRSVLSEGAELSLREGALAEMGWGQEE